MKNIFGLSLIFTVGLTLCSCKKDHSTKTLLPPIRLTPPAATGPFLYVGGTTFTSGIYWKNSLQQPAAHPVPDTLTGSGNISSIVTSGKEFYMAGQTGGYYKNDSFIPIPGAGFIQYLYLFGTALYAAGNDNLGNPASWQNNTEINLGNTLGRALFPDEGVQVSGVSGLAVSASHLLVSGSLFFENEPYASDSAAEGNFALLWDNGGLSVYGHGALISAAFSPTVGVALSGNDVYVAGLFPAITNGADSGGYWKNGVWNSINNGYFHPNSIAGFGNDVYIPGFTFTWSPTYSQQAAYWKNGTLVLLSGAVANAIAVYNSDVYVLGVDNNGNYVVWKNGAVFETLGYFGTSTITCIAIGQ